MSGGGTCTCIVVVVHDFLAGRWQTAFHRYAMGAAIVEHQLSYAAALAHYDVCMRIATNAHLSKPPRRAALGVIYDEVAR